MSTQPKTSSDQSQEHDQAAPPRSVFSADGAGASPPDDAPLGGGRADKPAPSPFDPLIERGVSREVWEARGYVPYFGSAHPDYNPAAVKAILAPFALSPGQKGTYTRFTNDATDEGGRKGYGDGLVMLKHPVPGAPTVHPQLRPRHELETGKVIRHRHGRAFQGRAEWLVRHILKVHDGIAPPENEEHLHSRAAKYLLPTRAYEPYTHDHATDPRYQGPKGLEKLCAHLCSQHGLGVQPWETERLAWLRDNYAHGEHKHRRPIPGQHIADRLDLHPLALERLLADDGGRVYFALEGCIKADSILSHLITSGTPGSVFDVPSVTLWNAPELSRFAQDYLTGRFVVIVVDADWYDNPQVVRQALLCRGYLRKRGIDAHVAAPPADRTDEGKLLYKGVDDFLAVGGDLDDLVVVDREAPFSLALYTNEEGQIRSSARSLAPLLGVRKSAQRVVETLWRYIDHGLLETDRELSLSESVWSDGLEWTGDNPESWPTLTVRKDCRYTESSLRLGDFTPTAPVTRTDIFLEEFYRSRSQLKPSGDIAAAIRATAERVGVSANAISQEPYVQWFRSAFNGARVAHAQLASRSDEFRIPPEFVVRTFGVDPKTISRDQQKPPSPFLHDLPKEANTLDAIATTADRWKSPSLGSMTS